MKAVRTIIRKYYKETIMNFVQPVLTENGEMGGDSFAVDQSSVYQSYYGYRVFDNDGTGVGWHSNQQSPAWLSWYNPEPLNITLLTITNSTNRTIGNAGSIQASNNNKDWITLKTPTFTTTLGATWEIDLSDNTEYYNYYRIYITSAPESYSEISQINITATVKHKVESTEDDYNYYEDSEKYNLVKETARKYYKYQNWEQPVFDSATTWGNVSADNYYSAQPPYQALDGKTSGGNESDFASDSESTVNWYWDFAEPLKISSIKIWNRNSADSYGGATTYTIYGKNKDGSYEQIGIISLPATGWASDSTSITSDKIYYGLKVYCEGTKINVGIGELLLTANTLVSSTISDYDYYEDIDLYKAINE